MIVTELSRDEIPFYNIVIRRKDNDAFIKAWAGQSKEFVDQRVRLARAGSSRLVLVSDLRALEVLEYMERYLAANAQMPTLRTIAIGMGIQYEYVVSSINYLVDRGFLMRIPHVARGTSIIKRRSDM